MCTFLRCSFKEALQKEHMDTTILFTVGFFLDNYLGIINS